MTKKEKELLQAITEMMDDLVALQRVVLNKAPSYVLEQTSDRIEPVVLDAYINEVLKEKYKKEDKDYSVYGEEKFEEVE